MIYLVTGESNRLINERLIDIIDGCDNVLRIDYNASSIDDILAEASYYSMFNDEKAIIVKNADFFGSAKLTEENSNKLLSYFNEPNILTNLIFVTNAKLDTRKKITKQIKDKYEHIEIPPLKGRELIAKTKSLFTKDGYEIDDASLNTIIYNNTSNYDLIYNEVDKIKLYYNSPCHIKYADVINIVARNMETNNFKFVDAIVNRDIKEAFKIYEDLKLMKVEPLALISLLAREFRLMLTSKILKQERYPINAITKELGLQDWQLEKILKNNTAYSLEELENRIKELAILDLNIKSGKIDKWLGLAKFIVDSAE